MLSGIRQVINCGNVQQDPKYSGPGLLYRHSFSARQERRIMWAEMDGVHPFLT